MIRVKERKKEDKDKMEICGERKNKKITKIFIYFVFLLFKKIN